MRQRVSTALFKDRCKGLNDGAQFSEKKQKVLFGERF